MKNKYQKQFIETFKKIMETKEFDESWSMNSIAGWDSLRHVRLISSLEEVLGIEFEFEDILIMTSIKKIDEVLSKY